MSVEKTNFKLLVMQHWIHFVVLPFWRIQFEYTENIFLNDNRKIEINSKNIESVTPFSLLKN